MISRTEKQLQEIADAISSIQNFPSVSQLTDQEKSHIKNELQKIGKIAGELPVSFTFRHSKVPWDEIQNWVSINTHSLSNQDISIISDARAILAKSKDRIARIAYADREIQSGILTSLSGHLDLHAKELYGRANSMAVLMSLTGILVVTRIALLNIGLSLNLPQFFIYLSNALPLIWIAWNIIRDDNDLLVAMPLAEDYYTHTDFYDDAREVIDSNIYEINLKLTKRWKTKKRQEILWYITAFASITATIIAAIF